jgi:hypothetical protein
MPEFTVQIICWAQVTARNEALARKIGNEIAKDIADSDPHLVYETEVGTVSEDEKVDDETDNT